MGRKEIRRNIVGIIVEFQDDDQKIIAALTDWAANKFDGYEAEIHRLRQELQNALKSNPVC